jgi:hypothetical protein
MRCSAQVHTAMVDTFPVNTNVGNTNASCASYAAGKYNKNMYKAQVGITFRGEICMYTGLHQGTKSDIRVWQNTHGRCGLQDARCFQSGFPRTLDWERWLADSAYVNCEHLTIKKKKPQNRDLHRNELFANGIIEFYRARCEQVIGQIQQRRAIFNTQRHESSYELMAAMVYVAVQSTALDLRMNGPRYPGVGPWPHGL